MAAVWRIPRQTASRAEGRPLDGAGLFVHYPSVETGEGGIAMGGVPTHVDHITVAAATLADGVAWVAERLGGLSIPVGGAHPVMGTHNHLLRLGESLFLEVIAPDPAVPEPPRRPRWFALDDPEFLTSLRQEGPRLATWVVRTSDIAGSVRSSSIPLGEPEPVGRGGLEWLITVPRDGALPEGGAMPTLIQWPQDQPHPAAGMVDFGFRMSRLDLHHPEPARLDAALDAIGLERAGVVRTVATPSSARLCAYIAMPSGDTAVLDCVRPPKPQPLAVDLRSLPA